MMIGSTILKFDFVQHPHAKKNSAWKFADTTVEIVAKFFALTAPPNQKIVEEGTVPDVPLDASTTTIGSQNNKELNTTSSSIKEKMKNSIVGTVLSNFSPNLSNLQPFSSGNKQEWVVNIWELNLNASADKDNSSSSVKKESRTESNASEMNSD